MAKAINTFLKSKMNKDLDARLIPNGEYRNAVNVQISKSEGDGVGTVENVLGNTLIFDFESITGVPNLYCIGYLSDDVSNTAFVFLTDNTTASYKETGVGSNHFVFACNPSAFDPVLLLTGPFLNLSQLNPIYGINLLESLLFWTDDRNQPRKININLANPEGATDTATYYTTEDQISVAKYNPYRCMELFQESYLSSVDGEQESTMKDVSSIFLPNGGKGDVAVAQAAGLATTILVSFVGDIQTSSSLYMTGSTLSVVDSITGALETPASLVGATVDTATFDSAASEWTINIIGGTFPALQVNQEIVLNPNPYYNANFPGDDDYLEDKFVRFSYRFKFEDNEYSVFAPFTQIAFIPKQDGYFMYVKESSQSLNVKTYDDQADAYRSTVVYFVENKVDDIILKIPLPFNNFDIQNNLKITEVDILYKEAQGLAVKVVDTIPVLDVSNSAGFFTVTSNSTVGGVSEFIASNIQGGVPVGGFVTGPGVTGKPKVTEFIPTNPNNPSEGGTVKIDLNETGVSSSTVLQVNDVTYFDYNYQSKKPFKTLPSDSLTRVYDKTPVKAFAQEISGNRVIYANYQDKHTPPEFLNYNVSVSSKSEFNLNKNEATYSSGFRTITAGQPLDIDLASGSIFYPGNLLSSNTPGVVIPPDTLVSSTNNNGEGVFITGLIAASGSSDDFLVKETNGFIPVGAVVSGNGVIPGTTVLSVVVGGGSLDDNEQYVTCSTVVTLVENQPIYFGSTSQTEAVISLSREVTFPAGVVDLDFKPESDVTNTTSVVEYPNSTLKQNRNYQVGVVLSDRYSRTSGVILSSNKSVVNVGQQAFSGSTIYSAYLDESTNMSSWPGNSLKLLFNETINSVKNPVTGTPGLYNGDPESPEYNPLGWYSYKIVVKQTEQEYYNVYAPGIMASYPENTNLEIGSTSHVVLINDNINKVPRDLSEVGPQQRQFRSSVQLFGRVENTSIIIDPAGSSNLGAANKPYYTGKESNTVSTISTITDMFDYGATLDKIPSPNYFPQFYSYESNPLIARISTESKIGQIATTNYNTISALTAESATTNLLKIKDISGDATSIAPGDYVLGGFSSEILVGPNGYTQGGLVISTTTTNSSQSDVITVTSVVGIAPGNIAIATGIPGGTSVVGVAGNNVTLSNVVNLGGSAQVEFFEADTLELTAAVSVSLNENIVVQPQANPGLQYLAVYETEPVESLLDIFWETSSSGLISDLNNAVLNDSSGGASLSEINTNVFDEGIQVGDNISTTPFSILDNFGSPVSFLEISSDLELVSAFNTLAPPESVTSYFNLVPNGANVNSYNIEVTQAFFNNIYFGENDTSSNINRRNFKLNLRAFINDLESNFSIDLNLANINPSISSPTPNQQLSRSTTDEVIIDIEAVNGSANSNFKKQFANGSCEITSVTNSVGNSVLDQNYFSVPTQADTTGASASWALRNNIANSSPLIPIDTYNVTARIKDAGGIQDSVSVSFSIDYGVSVRNVSQLTWREQYSNQIASFDGPSSRVTDIWVQNIVVFEVYAGGGSNQRGWYLYNGSWSSDTTPENFTLYTSSFGSAIGSPEPFEFNGSWPNDIPTYQGGNVFEESIISGPSMIPLIGSNTTTFANNNQVSIDASGANQPITLSTLATPLGGEAFLLFEPTSGDAGRTAIIDAWKTTRSAQQILKVQYPPNGLYANEYDNSNWVNTGSHVEGQFVRTIDIDENYGISSFKWTIPS